MRARSGTAPTFLTFLLKHLFCFNPKSAVAHENNEMLLYIPFRYLICHTFSMAIAVFYAFLDHSIYSYVFYP